MGESQDNHGSRSITRREFTISSTLSSLGGVVFSFVFASGRIPIPDWQLALFGAICGFFIGLPFLFAESIFGAWIDSLERRGRVAARIVIYFGAAVVGFGLGFPVSGLLVFARGR